MNDEVKMSDIVRVRSFAYDDIVDNPYQPGTKRVVQRVAVRGDQIDYEKLSPRDQERADRFDVFYTQDEIDAKNGVVTSTSTTSALDTDDVQALANWIKDDEPTITEVLELAGDDSELAKRLLDAENRATGNEPRKGVELGLQRIIGSA